MADTLPSIAYVPCGVGRIGCGLDVNGCGSNAYFEIPISATFAGRAFPISLILPASPSADPLGPLCVSFYATLSYSSPADAYTLRRPASPDCVFTNEAEGIYRCLRTGEPLVLNASDSTLTLFKPDGGRLRFSSSLTLASVILPDGLALSVSATSTKIALVAAGDPAFSASFLFSSGEVYYGSVSRGTGQYAFSFGSFLLSSSSSGYSVFASRACCDGQNGANQTFSDDYSCSVVASGAQKYVQSVTMTDGRTSGVYSLSLQRGSGYVSATAAAPGRSNAVIRLDAVNANLVKETGPDGRATYYGLHSFSSTEPPFVVGKMDDLGRAKAFHYDASRRLDEASDLFCYALDGGSARSMLGPAEFDSTWTAYGAYQMQSSVGEPTLGPLQGGLWLKGAGWHRAEKNSLGTLLPGEPALLAAVAFGVSDGSLTITAEGHFEDGTTSSCVGSFDVGAGCLAPICVPVCFHKPLSSVKVIVQGGSGCAVKAVQLLRGVSSRRYRHSTKWLGGSSYAGMASIASRDSEGRAEYSYGADPTPFVSYFEGSRMVSRSVDDLGYAQEADYSSPSSPSAYDPSLPYFQTEKRSVYLSSCLGRSTVAYSPTHRRATSLVQDGIPVSLSLNALGDARSETIGTRKATVDVDYLSRPVKWTFSLSDGTSASSQSATYANDMPSQFTDAAGKNASFAYDSYSRWVSFSANGSYVFSRSLETGWGGKLSYCSIGITSAHYSYDDYPEYRLPSEVSFRAFSQELFAWDYEFVGPDALQKAETLPLGIATETALDPADGVSSLSVSEGATAIYSETGRLGGSKKAVRYGPSSGRGAVVSPTSPVYRGDAKTISRALERDGWLCTRLWKEGDLALLWRSDGTYVDPQPSRPAPVASGRIESRPVTQFSGEPYPALSSSSASFAFSFYLASLTGFQCLFYCQSGIEIIVSSGALSISKGNASVAVANLRIGWNAACVTVNASGRAFVAANHSFSECQIGQCYFVGPVMGTGLCSSFVGVRGTEVGDTVARSVCLTVLDTLLDYSAQIGGEDCLSAASCHSYSSDSSGCQGAVGVPLDGTIASSDGRGPSSLSLLAGVCEDPDPWLLCGPLARPSAFEFCPAFGRPMWRAMGTRLSYSFPGTSAGSVRMDFFRSTSSSVGQLFEIRSSSNLLGAYLSSGLLRVETESQSASAGINVAQGTHTLFLSYVCVTTSSGCLTYVTAKVDQGSPVALSLSASGPIGGSPVIHIGSDGSGAFPFNGLIGNVVLMKTAAESSGMAAYESNGLQASAKAGRDALGRVTVVERSALGSPSRRTKISYVQDASYGGTSRVSKEQIYSGGSLERTVNYQYDSAGRLSSWDGSSVSYSPQGFLLSAQGHSFQYDAAGNVTSMAKPRPGMTPSTETLTMSYLSTGAQNRLSKVTSSLGWSVNYSYSTYFQSWPSSMSLYLGQALQRSVSLSYCYGFLVSANVDGATKAYAYSPDGNLAAASFDGSVRRYVFNGDGRLIVDSRSDGYALSYEYGPDGNPWLLVETSSSQETRYLITCDRLGRILRLDRVGPLGGYAEYSYTPWGEPTLVSDTAGGIGSRNRLLYKSYLYDDELEAYCLGKRHYVPMTGRFLEPDEANYLDASTCGGLNLYAYCYNDPITYSDPTGHAALVIGLIAGIIIGAVVGGTYGGLTAAATGATGWQIAGAIGIGVLAGGIMGAGAGFGSVALTSGIFGAASWSGVAWCVGVGVSAFSGVLGGFTMDTLSQRMYYGDVKDWESVGWSSLQGGVINVLSMLSTSVGGGAGSSWTANLAMNFVMGFPVSGVSFTFDMLRYYVWIPEEEKERRRRKTAFAWSW